MYICFFYLKIPFLRYISNHDIYLKNATCAKLTANFVVVYMIFKNLKKVIDS